jgi:hypothetical protein
MNFLVNLPVLQSLDCSIRYLKLLFKMEQRQILQDIRKIIRYLNLLFKQILIIRQESN